MTIPAPSTFHFRQGRKMVSKEAYPDLDAFFADVGTTWGKAIGAFYDAGCRYLQLDDTAWAMMCDPGERTHSKERGDDPDKLPEIYARVTNAALKDKPADMTVTMHTCRGNFRSTFIASGGYEFAAEQLLAHTGLDGYFLEYDSDRAGGFEPLKYSRRQRAARTRFRHLEKRPPGEEGRHQAAHRQGDQICGARAALPVAGMRLRLDRGRQCARRGRAVGEAADDRRARRRSLGGAAAG